MYAVERFDIMDRQSQLLILFSGLLGLTLAILTAKPKKAVDAVIAALAGLFGALVIAPAFAEALTNMSLSFSWLSWANATPGTAFFSAIIGLGAMLGFQMVVALKDNVISLLVQFAKNKVK